MELKPCKNGNSIIGGRFHVGEYLLYANEESTHVANYLIKDKKEKDKHHCAKYGERLIGFDSINVLKENNVDTGLAWYDQMDFTRHKFGNDVKYHNSKDLITYKHYVISPDPKDNISLPEFQAFVHDYVEHWFGDYECAMAYHADNANEIMHCHLIVNNTNLKTGGRVSSYLSNKVVNKMQEDLQLRALEVGYHAFDENGDSLTKEEMQQRGTRVTSSKYESQRIKRAKAATKSDNKQRSTPAHSFKPKRGSKRNFETKTESSLKSNSSAIA